MKIRTLERSIWLPRPRKEAFEFFGNAENLELLTPPWLRFRILTPRPVTLRPGAEIRYSLRVRGIPIRWLTEITEWEPPFRFVDIQKSGPYRQWVHEHRFEEESGGTRIVDRVEYAVAGGPLEPLIHRFVVGPDLERIFDYREAAARRELETRVSARRVA